MSQSNKDAGDVVLLLLLLLHGLKPVFGYALDTAVQNLL